MHSINRENLCPNKLLEPTIALRPLFNTNICSLSINDLREYLPDLVAAEKAGKLPTTLKAFSLEMTFSCENPPPKVKQCD